VVRLAPALAFAFAIWTIGAAAPPLPPLHVGVSFAVTDSPTDAAMRTSSAGAPCPAGTLPDNDVCVHLPTDPDEAPEAPVAANAHHERSGRWSVYDQIPRRPDRPADYDAYKYPIAPGIPGGHSVVSGYDLDRPDPLQRRGPTLRAVGHGGLDLPQAKGTPVVLLPLEHQQGDADVLYAGPYFGTTVMTRQTVREGGKLHDYVVIFGHLDAIAPGVEQGHVLKDGDLVGYVGDSGSPELVHLHYETRRVREGVDVMKHSVEPARLLDNSVSIACDPRNVLPLRQ